MTDLDQIYSDKILSLSASLASARRLEVPQATATAQSKLCGSTITVDLSLEAGRVSAFGMHVKACLLGQASAAVVAREIIGMTPHELRAVGNEMRAMLKAGGPPPTGKWADLAVLETVRDYTARHASALLVFDAVDEALDIAEAKTAIAAPATENVSA